MKYFLLIFILSITSCTTSKVASDVAVSLINKQLSSERYSAYETAELCIVEQADNGVLALNTYEYAYKTRFDHIPNHTQLHLEKLQSSWPIDSNDILKLRTKLHKSQTHFWRESDFPTRKVSLITHESIQNSIVNQDYLDKPGKLVLFISKPIFIDDRLALLSYSAGNTKMGFRTIDRFTALMIKVGKSWIIHTIYYDGVYY